MSGSLPLAALALSMLLSSLGTSIANVALPNIAHVFGVPFAAVQWVVLAYLLAVTVLVVLAGRLGDAMGRRRLLLTGLAVFTAGSALCGLVPESWAPGPWALVAARAVQGAGAAAMMALTLAFVGTAVPPERTGRAMGVVGSTSAAGTALGPAVGGILIAAFGWRGVFWICVPLGLAAFGLAWRALPADIPASRPARGFDLAGAALLAVALVAYALAMTVGQGWGQGWGLLVAAAAAGAFVAVEARASDPLIRLGLLHQPALASGFAMSLLVTTVVMATLVVGPFHLSGALGLGVAGVGLAMSAGPLVAALAGVPAGRLVDRHGARRMTRAGLGGMVAGCAALAAVPAAFGAGGYIAGLALLTGGYALFQAANNTAVMGAVPPAEKGVVSGLLTLSRNLGLVTGASVMGATFAWGAGGSGTPAAIAAGTATTFAVAAVLVVAALGLAGQGVRLARQSG